MELKPSEIEQLLTVCPKSLDPWTLEPLHSVAFFDPLINQEELPLSEARPPISFPDPSLPLAHFDAEVPRDFDSGEVVDDHIVCSCSGSLFPSDATSASNLTSQETASTVDSFLADICKLLSPSYSNDGKSLLKECFTNIPTVSADSLVDGYLSLCSEEFLPLCAQPSRESTSNADDVESDSRLEKGGKEGKKDKVDLETQAAFIKLLRHTSNEVTSHAVLESSTEMLAPLTELIPDPAFEWPFELDTFQKQAILCLERNQSVLVAAHTSAGKTVVAEYACAMCKRRGSRAIYTSPIKALSNQKFRDFRQTFGDDVGLLTGDIKVATKSSILVMTTEILHNMLCNSADTIRDLEIVIMDEVHYMNDKDRGHVWEQLMILLPQHVLLVLLSATLPNALEFADWLGRIRGGTIIHVCQTHRRPVPLEHHLYTGCDSATRENIYLVVDKEGRFNREGYQDAKNSLIKPKKVSKKGNVSKTVVTDAAVDPDEIARKEAKRKPKSQFTGGKINTPGRQNYTPKATEGYNRSGKSDITVWSGLIRMLQEHELMPVIVFCFSRAKINNLVQCLNSIDLLNKTEKNEVVMFLRAAIGPRLKGSDKLLSQVLLVRNLTVRGIAIHHAGMLPLLKEVVEMLFQRGLVRILFATETFAMGVNMPARSVIFTAIQKHDGDQRRPLTAGEYTQMAGRAGRRGLDSTGTVIIVANNCDSPMPTDLQLQQMLLGQATKLTSRFKVTYSMILYLHRGNLQTPQELIHQSFMHANDLRYELARKRQLDWLRQLVNASTVHKATPRTLIGKAAPVTVSIPADDDALLTHAEVRCPAYPLDSPDSTATPCVEAIAGYYLACCRWRELSYTCSSAAGNQPLSTLSKVFSPGRLVQLQLSTESMRSAVQNMSGGRFAAYVGSKCVPNWITVGVVLEITRVTNVVALTVVTWELPSSPMGDCAAIIGGTPEEEDILVDGEQLQYGCTPFPPHLMPKYRPKSQEESKLRLVVVTEVPLTTLLGVSCSTIEGASDKAFVETVLRDLTWFRQQQMASAEGLHVVVQKKRDDDVGGSAARRRQVCPLSAINEALFTAATAIATSANESGGFESIPFWQHLGLDGPEVEEWMALTEELSAPLVEHRLSSEMSACANLIAHLSLMHRVTRRRWAIKRLNAKLSRNQDTLLDDYEARVRVLEELGFLDKDTRSGCLTRKGRVACELQQMEVLLSEILFDGSIIQLSPPDIAALLSCFVCESGMAGSGGSGGGGGTKTPKNDPLAPRVALVSREEIENAATTFTCDPADLFPLPATVPEHLQSIVRLMLTKAEQLQRLQLDYGVHDAEADTRLNPVLVGATYAWACGQPFSAVIGLTNTSGIEVPEGHVLRALQRLDELLRHVCVACRNLGDQTLAARIDAAHLAVHRDMVCAPSLYVADEISSVDHGTSHHEVEQHQT
ncbi:DNA RNA helicase C terminal [Echinococcus multilocularis]|uniref:DNA RNA helicase C terminal n=1 Tax=Echinococcus multilocularis TaxID=6211 RepID=A0A068XY94_ECHMU|nr:DNA RNA helicase C terminal [Echinococcus multilocularis]